MWQEYTAPPLFHTARWTLERECGSHRQQPTSLKCSLATHHLSNQHVCGRRTVGFSFPTASCVHVHHFFFVPYSALELGRLSYTPCNMYCSGSWCPFVPAHTLTLGDPKHHNVLHNNNYCSTTVWSTHMYSHWLTWIDMCVSMYMYIRNIYIMGYLKLHCIDTVLRL